MRLRKGISGTPLNGTSDDYVAGEQVNSGRGEMASCGDVSVNGSKGPMEGSSSDKGDSGKAKEVHFEKEDFCISLDGCGGEGVLTQDEEVEGKDRQWDMDVEVVEGVRGRVSLGGKCLPSGVDAYCICV